MLSGRPDPRRVTIADGLIVRMDEYRTHTEALAAMHERREAIQGPQQPVAGRQACPWTT